MSFDSNEAHVNGHLVRLDRDQRALLDEALNPDYFDADAESIEDMLIEFGLENGDFELDDFGDLTTAELRKEASDWTAHCVSESLQAIKL